MILPGPVRRPSPGGETCSSCENFLTANEVAHGVRRCKQCRVAHPRVAQTRELREEPKPLKSPWEGKSRDELSAWVAEKDKERRKGSATFAYPIGSGGLP